MSFPNYARVKMETTEGRRGNGRVWPECVSKCSFQGTEGNGKQNANGQVVARTIADVSIPQGSRHGFPLAETNSSVSEMMGNEERKSTSELLSIRSVTGDCISNLHNTASGYGPVRKQTTVRNTPYTVPSLDTPNKLQHKVFVPADPQLWNSWHVQQWIEWAVLEYGLRGVDPTRFLHVDGRQLCRMSRDELCRLVAPYEADVLYTHLSYLRQAQLPLPPMSSDNIDRGCSGMTPNTAHNHWSYPTFNMTDSMGSMSRSDTDFNKSGWMSQSPNACARGYGSTTYPGMTKSLIETTPPAWRTQDPYKLFGHLSSRLCNTGSGQIQLWQFLLELLSDSRNATCITWEGTNGEFKLVDPDETARRWGERKSKPNMNYDKLSRALRYYYDKNIMTKVHGKRYAYKFDFAGLAQAIQPSTPDPTPYRHQDLFFPSYTSSKINFTNPYAAVPPVSSGFLASPGNYWSGHNTNMYPNLQNPVLPNSSSHVTPHIGSCYA